MFLLVLQEMEPKLRQEKLVSVGQHPDTEVTDMPDMEVMVTSDTVVSVMADTEAMDTIIYTPLA